MANLALLDLVLPYVLRGENLGSFHALASALRVTSYEQAADELGVTIRGRGEFNGWARLFPNGTFSVAGGVDEAAPVYDPANRQPVFDLAETAIEFELLVPRVRSDIVFAGEGSLGTDTASQQTKAVLDALAGPAGGPTTDYPSTGFVLDLILDAPGLRPPFLHPAKLADTGTLAPDDSVKEVTVTLPRLRFRLSHGDANPSLLRFELTSFGATGLDDPGDLGVAELISMSPPYAYIGGADSTTVGIGFRSATLDLSADTTPAALKDKAGVGDDWTGLYLPEARVFFSPNGVRNLAVEGGAHEFLFGIGHDSAGIWGDFEFAVIEQGDGKPVVSARFVDANDKTYGIETTGATTATARLPAHTRMIVDVSGGRMPYARTVTVDGGTAETGTIFVIDLSSATDNQAEIAISVTDKSPVPKTVTLTITAQLVATPAVLPSGAPTPPASQLATMTPPSGTPTIVLQSQTATDVVFTTTPPDATLMWKVDSDAETGPSASISVPVAPGQQRTVTARKPATAAAARSDTIYFFFDRPPPMPDDTYPRPDSSSKAVSKTVNIFEPPDVDPLTQYKDHFDAVAQTAHDTATDISVTIEGRASYEGIDDAWHRQHNYLLAGRRAQYAHDLIAAQYPEPHLVFTVTPDKTAPTTTEINQWVTDTDWNDPAHQVPNDRDYWCAIVGLPAVSTPEHTSTVTITRPAAPPPPVVIVPVDPTPTEPDPPGWFRSFKLMIRVVKGDVIAAEADLQVFMQAFVEESLQPTAVNTDTSPTGRSLQQGVPVGPDNPTDGITNFRLLVQSDPSTGREQIVGSIGADPADTSGLMVWGWLPGEQRAPRDIVRNLMGSYLTFWPLLADLPLDAAASQASSESPGAAIVDVGLSVVAMGIPAVIGALPFLEVERIVWYGAEVHVGLRHGTDEVQTDILVDVAIAWATTEPIVDVLSINPEKPLTVRYKAIGVHSANRDATGQDAFELHPIFDASRGYTIDVQGSGSLVVADPLGKILRILAARLSRTNPLTLEIDIGMSVDLGVITVDRAGVRVYLDDPSRLPELTALGVSVDIAGALVGSGFVQMAHSTDPQGHPVATIGGQLDLTLRPIDLRVAAAVEIATIDVGGGRSATGVYVGLDIVLPVGIPLGTSGLGIFGFRGIFGMHYDRSTQWDTPGQPSSALVWLEHADGEPNKLANKQGDKLWVPYLDHWAFGAGILIGTMEGGFILNLDGTLLIQLPGPRIVIMMNARIISLPPDMDEIGGSGGILAVIEITPDHFLVGVLISWEIPDLVTIKIPVEALFPFGSQASKWHVYLGARPDLGQPIEVDVLGIVKGTGYLMAKGDGFPAYPVHGFTLPALTGFSLGLGVAASFTWGDTDVGLYLRIGGGMDAELGFQPFTLAGVIYVSGELRLFIVSIGADAQLNVIVAEHDGDFGISIDGKACGHVSFLFFDVSGCVEISLSSGDDSAPPIPKLVAKVSLQSRSPALAQGTGVDRGIDVSLGDALDSDATPGAGAALPVVPVDAIPIISMVVPPAVANNSLGIGGLNTNIGSAPGAPDPASTDDNLAYCEHGGDRYQYVISAITLERIDPATGQPIADVIDEPSGPAVWWTLAGPTDPSPVAQLALLTWAPSPATKAIEKTDRLTDSLTERYGTICAPAAPAAEQMWTFRFEPIGFSGVGWDLEGITWPDPAGSVRSAAPPSTLHVSERWRSGDPVLDAQRGIFPAYVLAGSVPCDRGQPTSPYIARLLQSEPIGAAPTAPTVAAAPSLVVGGRGPVTEVAATGAAVPEHDPVHAALVRNPGQLPTRISPALHAKVTASLAIADSDVSMLTVDDAVRALHADTSIGVSELRLALSPARLVSAVVGSASDNASRGPSRAQCTVHVLQAPMLDDGRPVVIGDQSRSKVVAVDLAAHGVTHGELDDVVVIATGAFISFGLLLFVRDSVLEGDHLIVRALGADGTEHDRAVVTAADIVWSRPLPPHWTDTSGPWAADIEDLLQWAQSRNTVPVYVTLDKDEKADRVEIGTRGLRVDPVIAERAERGLQIVPQYYVAAIAETRWSEQVRADWDDTQQANDEQVLTQLLGSASDTNAFLSADSLYRITVSSTGKRLNDSDAPTFDQHYWFRTDRIVGDPADATKLQFASTPPIPVRLDSWLLMTIPDEAEKGYFGKEDVKLVFNTQDIDRLLTRYGKKLQIRFQAASAQHPESTPAVPHPFPVDPSTVVPVSATLLSPFEDALVSALSQLGDAATCIPVDGNRVRQSQVDIPIPLNSCTDYLLDVELVDVNAGADAAGPSIFRRHFSTGLYATFEQFAGSIISPTPTARAVPAGAFGAIASFFAGRRPAGSELDDQLRAHGIEPLETPTRARVVVFWEQSGTADPQPAAVLVDATEPLFRSRNYPTKVTDATGPVPSERWVLAPREWLLLRLRAATSAALAPNGIVVAPGAQRAFVVLAPGQRGKELALELVAAAFADLPFLDPTERAVTVFDMTFSAAPWEEA
jgi:large repetitive protein